MRKKDNSKKGIKKEMAICICIHVIYMKGEDNIRFFFSSSWTLFIHGMCISTDVLFVLYHRFGLHWNERNKLLWIKWNERIPLLKSYTAQNLWFLVKYLINAFPVYCIDPSKFSNMISWFSIHCKKLKHRKRHDVMKKYFSMMSSLVWLLYYDQSHIKQSDLLVHLQQQK